MATATAAWYECLVLRANVAKPAANVRLDHGKVRCVLSKSLAVGAHKNELGLGSAGKRRIIGVARIGFPSITLKGSDVQTSR
jgi:hypothetical protein